MTDLTDSGDPEPAWILVYVDGIETAAEAATARGALGDAEAPQSGAGEGAVTFSMAEFAMLEGRVADARVPLELLTRSCTALVRPIEQTRAFELLGEVDEEQGDRDAACSAYRTVLSRWGNAKPRSVTADKARARAKGLGCSP
jgi:serine/threonine-protein kinase